MGLQIPSGMDNEVSVSSAGRGCGAELPRIAPRGCDEQRDDHLCGLDQPGSCAYADWNTATAIGIESSAVPEGQELASIVNGVQGTEETLLGPTLVGSRLLGGIERECNG